MDTLPIEVLEEICRHLTAAELAVCGAVCRRWRQLFDHDSLWKPRCGEALEDTLRTTPCVTEPPFVSPENTLPDTLSLISRWRLAYMRENHLWNNWRRGNYRVASIPVNDICHTIFISNDLILRVFDNVSGFSDNNVVPTIKIYDVKTFPPALLKETTNEHGGWAECSYFLNNKLVMCYDEYSIVFNLDVLSESVMDFQYKICLPKQEFPDGTSTAPRFKVTPTAILGWNPIRYYTSETLHIWDLEDGTERKVEESPKAKPYGFSDVITSESTGNAVVVVSNDVNCESFMLCAHFEPREEITITYFFNVYNANELKYLPFVEVIEAEHRIRYKCKIHRNYIAIAINGFLRIYNYQSHDLLTATPVVGKSLGNTLQTTFLDVVDDCFAFINDHTFKMFHPTSRTFVALVDLQVKEFNVISDSLVTLVKKQSSPEVWRIGRRHQQRLGDNISDGKINKSSTRVLTEDPSYYNEVFKDAMSLELMLLSIRGIFKCPKLTEWCYYW